MGLTEGETSREAVESAETVTPGGAETATNGHVPRDGQSSPRERPPRPTLGQAPDAIAPTDPFAIAGRKAMWLQVGRMLEREETLRDPSETDALKRYRVATRRLRAAFRVFREAYPKKETKALLAGLRDLATVLGRVRDLDVRIEEVDRWAKERGEDAVRGVAPLRAALVGERQAAAATLERKLGARGHEKLMTALTEFVTVADTVGGLHDGGPERMTRDRAASAIWTAYEEVRAYISVVRWADLATLHGLRIRAKRLRYTIEFLGTVLGPEREWLIERLVALQDHLGALNDATLAVSAIRAFLSERHASLTPEERAAIVGYLADRERERNRLRRSVGRVWRPVVSTTFGRRLGRAVVVRQTA